MFVYYLIIVHIYVNVCKHVHVMTICRVQEPFERISSVLSVYCVGPWNQIWVVILASGIFSLCAPLPALSYASPVSYTLDVVD